MLEMKKDQLIFTFPEVHPEARCEIEFQRTLRIPDDGKTYPLPPGLGAFPLRHVEDFKERLTAETRERGGVMLPMYQSEALWIRFSAAHLSTGQGQYRFAVKIAAGKRSAITAGEWTTALKDGDYVVIPVQPWIDGFVVSEGKIKQFVAAPLGMGFTVEEQLTQKAEFGGIQIEVIPMKRDEFERRFPKPAPRPVTSGILRSSQRLSLQSAVKVSGHIYGSDGGEVFSSVMYSTDAVGASLSADVQLCETNSRGEIGSVTKSAAAINYASMGMAAGGSMKQDIFPDPYGLDVWDTNHRSRTFVHLFNSMAWEQVTGSKPPHVPPTAALYNKSGLPWYEYYSDGKGVSATKEGSAIKSVAEISKEKGFTILPENTSSEPQKIASVKAPEGLVKDGVW